MNEFTHKLHNSRIELLLQETAKRFSHVFAIQEWDGNAWQQMTYAVLIQQSQAFAEALQKNNMKPGERVVLMSHNRIQAVVALLGIWIAKGTAVLIDPELPDPDRKNQCLMADARFLIVENETTATIDDIAINAGYIITIHAHELKWQSQDRSVSKTIFDDCSEDIATILFTSGTTGTYKGVMLSHHNYIYLTQFYKNLTPQEGCSLTVLPLFHVAGLFCGFLQPLFLGVRIVMFRTFSVEALQHAFAQFHPTILISVPRLLTVFDDKIKLSVAEQGVIAKNIFYFSIHICYFFDRYLGINLGKLLFHSLHQKMGGALEKILCGSAQLPLSVQKRFLSFGFEVLCSYGLTETCGPITLTKRKYRWRLGNVGPCVNQADLKISAQGEVMYRGPALMMGYFRDTETTQSAHTDGFFHTRDLGHLDRFGNLFISGRIKELIVFSDGKKAMPEQIEKQYAGIEHIKEYTIFSSVHQSIPIAVLAFVPEENSDVKNITQKIFERASRLKSPYRISDVLVVKHIPRSSTLKVKRYELEAQFNKEKKIKQSDSVEKSTHENQIAEIIRCFQFILPEKKSRITADITFAELNIDSLLAAQLCQELNIKLGVSLQPTIFWFSHTIRELDHYLRSEKRINISQGFDDIKNRKYQGDHIAVVAMDCIFPGAKDFSSFWKNLVVGKDVITEIPQSRWNNQAYYDPYPLAPGKTNSRCGGFIDLPDHFHCDQFGIKPRIANAMDPQQKILLQLTKRLLENFSGKAVFDQWKGSNMGFFLGAGFPDFMLEQIKQLPLSQINPYSGMGMADFSMTARVAFHFGFEGPAMLIKTACSSGLVAVHQAMRALQSGDCDYAIAGGINLIQSPEISVCLTKGGFLSPEGRCKSFDANANGYVRSEGCGLVLLKRYEEALRDNDTILSVIMGSAMNQDGASNGITAPNGNAQIKCYQAALANAALSADKIGYIESHGSGTQLGDAIEMQSIQMVYDKDHASDNPLWVGAVKSSIGHCESAAGIAGLIKTMGVLNHQLIPPNLHYQKPNPSISFENSSVLLPLKQSHFDKRCEYAAVSSFGVAGTNVHMILGVSK